MRWDEVLGQEYGISLKSHNRYYVIFIPTDWPDFTDKSPKLRPYT